MPLEIKLRTFQGSQVQCIFPSYFAEDSESPSYICKIIAIIKEKSTKVAHVRWLERGENTIFGDLADPKEVFAVYDCEYSDLSAVL